MPSVTAAEARRRIEQDGRRLPVGLLPHRFEATHAAFVDQLGPL